MKTMLEYQKNVLEKVSFDKKIFNKELMKSIKWLNINELISLSFWLIIHFKNSHKEAIKNLIKYIIKEYINNRKTRTITLKAQCC